MALQSVAQKLASLPADQRAAALALLTEGEAASLLYDWRGFLARPDQIAPDGDWDIWLALAGRGWGKTETGAQWVKEKEASGARSIALVAETQKDLEEVMVSRLLAIYPEHERPKVRYKPVRITWPSGAVALGYNGTEPDQLRGPEFEAAWVDELAKYRYAQDTWDMLQFCMRAGRHPQQLITTTPRPIEVIKAIMAGKEGRVVVTRGVTADNAANLAAPFLKKITERYQNTRLGRQELGGEILGDLPGALWSLASIDAYRLQSAPDMKRVLVSVDPAVTNTEDSDEHGIIVGGITDDQRGVILEDASMEGSPAEWARRAVSLYRSYAADGIVIEVNQGGDMVAHTIRTVDPNARIIEVRASRGKHVRAEPIAALYEQGRVSHVGGFPHLESQMTQMTTHGYEGAGSPDRVDALVWLLTELMGDMVRLPPNPERFRIGARRVGWMGR